MIHNYSSYQAVEEVVAYCQQVAEEVGVVADSAEADLPKRGQPARAVEERQGERQKEDHRYPPEGSVYPFVTVEGHHIHQRAVLDVVVHLEERRVLQKEVLAVEHRIHPKAVHVAEPRIHPKVVLAVELHE